jgi:hypothetical protein
MKVETDSPMARFSTNEKKKKKENGTQKHAKPKKFKRWRVSDAPHDGNMRSCCHRQPVIIESSNPPSFFLSQLGLKKNRNSFSV